MDGIWKYERKGGRVQVQIDPFIDLPAWARQAVEQEAERLALFLGGELDLKWGLPGKVG
jgi:hypothetical protein